MESWGAAGEKKMKLISAASSSEREREDAHSQAQITIVLFEESGYAEYLPGVLKRQCGHWYPQLLLNPNN